MVAHGLEAIFVSNVIQCDDFAVGRGIRVRTGLHYDFLFFCLPSWGTISIKCGCKDFLRETGPLVLDSISSLKSANIEL